MCCCGENPEAFRNTQEYTSCLDEILAFHAPKDIPKINILLTGNTGSGKSSIVATVDSLIKGRISRRVAHGMGAGTYTRSLEKYCFEIERPGANEGIYMYASSFMFNKYLSRCHQEGGSIPVTAIRTNSAGALSPDGLCQ